MKYRAQLLPAVLAAFLLTMTTAAPAQSGGGSYLLNPSLIAGGGGASSQGNYGITGSTGQFAAGCSSGGSFAVGSGFWGCGAAPTTIVVNDQVSFTILSQTLVPPTVCASGGYLNDYVLNARLTNIGSSILNNLSFQVLELDVPGNQPANPFRLITADDFVPCTSGGRPGATQAIPGITLAPGQSTDVTFRIAMPRIQRFRFFVSVLGAVASAGKPAEGAQPDALPSRTGLPDSAPQTGLKSDRIRI